MSINLTERAVAEVKRIIAEGKVEEEEEHLPDPALRLRIVGGGCSGFSTKLDLDPVTTERDEVFDVQGVKVAVDKRSLVYAEGATIDFLNDLNRRGFKVDLPGATGKCGCGSSFSF